MNLGKKQATSIYYQNKLIYIGEVKDYKDYHSLLVDQEKAKENFEQLINFYQSQISAWQLKVCHLEKDIEKIKAELAYNRGEITKEEYESWNNL